MLVSYIAQRLCTGAVVAESWIQTIIEGAISVLFGRPVPL